MDATATDRLSGKLRRFRSMASIAGWIEALRFEFMSSCRADVLSITVGDPTATLRIRRCSSDLLVFDQIFIRRELAECLPFSPKLIIDGGANVGFSTVFYASMFPDCTVIAVEPNDDNFAALQTNCSDFSNVITVHGGLWSTSGFLRTELDEGGYWACKVRASDSGPGSVRAWTVPELLTLGGQSRANLLKLDIEGAECELFGTNSVEWIDTVDAILIECHGADAETRVRSAIGGRRFSERRCGEKLAFERI
jgi:FkbM family methyltransferase